MRKLIKYFVLLIAVFCHSGNAAILISEFSSPVNDRFSNDPSFIGAGQNFSGVAIADTTASLGAWDDGGRWVTMISPDVFLSVQHASFYPANGQTVTFHTSNDPLGGSTVRTVQSSQRIGTSDIRIGVLDAPLPSSYAYYDYATETFETTGLPPGTVIDTSLAPYYGETAFMFGRSPSTWATSQDMAVGQNVIDRWIVDFDGTHDAVGAIRDSDSDPSFVASEAYLIAGDSGGPLMVDDGFGNLTIVGLNWFSGTLGDGSQINGFSYLGNYSDEIDVFLATNSVPELRQIALFLGLVTALMINRRRNPAL